MKSNINKRKIISNLLNNHIFIRVSVSFLILGKTHESLLLLRNIIENLIYHRLRRKYLKFARMYYENQKNQKSNHKKSNIVWVCWLQGMDKAPSIVKACYRSLKRILKNKEIIVISFNNMNDFIKLPDYIIKKYEKGYISKTELSDMIRLELLIKYGGLWIDSTVLCTGDKLIESISNEDLFMFQILKPGFDGHTLRFSNWFIYANSNNEVLMLTRYLMYTYWKRNNKLASYFLFHNFLEIAFQLYPQAYRNILPFSSELPHELQLCLFDSFDIKKFNFICQQSDFHKLTYKVDKDNKNKKETYYEYIIKTIK